MKIQTRITVLFTLLCSVIIIALSIGIYYFTYQNASQDFYTRLQLRANIAARAYLESSADTAAFAAVRREHLRRLPDEREYLIDLDTLLRLNKAVYNQMPPDFIRRIISNKEASYRNDFDFFYGIQYSNNNKTYLVIVSAENSFLKEFLKSLQQIMITACVVGVVVIFSISLFFSREILAPVRTITKRVKNITATSLHMRLNSRNSKDEMAELTNTFNNMLSRLETAFETQNNFVSNASHELNTPLTAIIGEADFALSKMRPEEQYRQSLHVIFQQGEKLQQITQSLVQLARSGFRESFTPEPVDINELVHNARQSALQVYHQCDIQINLSLYSEQANRLRVPGNAQLLELALSNVLMNACKYSNLQPVSLAIALSAHHVIIIVKDNGIGIPAEDIKNIFNPFFRASNVQTIDGYGIGLPLTQNVIKLHNGTIAISSGENKGTEVVIKLPLK